MRRVEARLGVLLGGRGLVDEAVGQHHRPHLEALVEQPGGGEILQHVGREAADRALLDRDQHLVLAYQAADQVGVERLGKAGVGHRGAEPLGRQILGRHQAFGEPRAEAQDRDLAALAHDAALADLERCAARRQLDADALAARIAEGRGAVIDVRRRGHHVHQLKLVGRRHDHEARQAGEIGDVEGAGVGGAVGADQPGAVDGEAHRQALDGDVDLGPAPIESMTLTSHEVLDGGAVWLRYKLG